MELGAHHHGGRGDDRVGQVEQADERSPDETGTTVVYRSHLDLAGPASHQQADQQQQGAQEEEQEDAGGGGHGVDKPVGGGVATQHRPPQARAHADGQGQGVDEEGARHGVAERRGADVEDATRVPHHGGGDEREHERDEQRGRCEDEQVRDADPVAHGRADAAGHEGDQADRRQEGQHAEHRAARADGHEIEDQPQLGDGRGQGRQCGSCHKQAGERDGDDGEHDDDMRDGHHGHVPAQPTEGAGGCGCGRGLPGAGLADAGSGATCGSPAGPDLPRAPAGPGLRAGLLAHHLPTVPRWGVGFVTARPFRAAV